MIKKYNDVTEHPRWKELVNLKGEMDVLKYKSQKLRELIDSEVSQ